MQTGTRGLVTARGRTRSLLSWNTTVRVSGGTQAFEGQEQAMEHGHRTKSEVNSVPEDKEQMQPRGPSREAG